MLQMKYLSVCQTASKIPFQWKRKCGVRSITSESFWNRESNIYIHFMQWLTLNWEYAPLLWLSHLVSFYDQQVLPTYPQVWSNAMPYKLIIFKHTDTFSNMHISFNQKATKKIHVKTVLLHLIVLPSSETVKTSTPAMTCLALLSTLRGCTHVQQFDIMSVTTVRSQHLLLFSFFFCVYWQSKYQL